MKKLLVRICIVLIPYLFNSIKSSFIKSNIGQEKLDRNISKQKFKKSKKSKLESKNMVAKSYGISN